MIAAVFREGEVLTTIVGTAEHHDSTVFQFNNTRLLHRHASGFAHAAIQFRLAATPGLASIVRKVTQSSSLASPLGPSDTMMLRNGHNQPARLELNDPVVVEDVVTDFLLGNANQRLTPRLGFVFREPHARPAILR